MSVFNVDNAFRFISILHDPQANKNTFVLMDLFHVDVTPVSALSIYEAVLLSMESAIELGFTSDAWSLLMAEVVGPHKFDCQKMQAKVRKGFVNIANNAISPLCDMTFNMYLGHKRASQNKWSDMPGNHGIGEPAVIAQIFKLNITVIWVVDKAWHMWSLPYGGDDPFLLLLYTNMVTTTQGTCITITAAVSAPRFFSLKAMVQDWENSDVFCESMPESQPAGYSSIAFKSGDREFSLQSVIVVESDDGASSEESEVTTASQFFNDFVDDSYISPDSSLMTPPSIKAANVTRLEAKLAHIKAVNAINAQFIRRRRIIVDSDDE